MQLLGLLHKLCTSSEFGGQTLHKYRNSSLSADLSRFTACSTVCGSCYGWGSYECITCSDPGKYIAASFNCEGNE